jgi:hypothetical protein
MTYIKNRDKGKGIREKATGKNRFKVQGSKFKVQS